MNRITIHLVKFRCKRCDKTLEGSNDPVAERQHKEWGCREGESLCGQCLTPTEIHQVLMNTGRMMVVHLNAA